MSNASLQNATPTSRSQLMKLGPVDVGVCAVSVASRPLDDELLFADDPPPPGKLGWMECLGNRGLVFDYRGAQAARRMSAYGCENSDVVRVLRPPTTLRV